MLVIGFTVLLTLQSGDAASIASVAQAVQILGRQLRIEQDADVPQFRRALETDGISRLHRLLTQLTAAQLNLTDGDPENALRAVYDPWDGFDDYTQRHPRVLRDSTSSRVFVSWLLRFGGRGAPQSRFVFQAYSRKGGAFALIDETTVGLDDHGAFVVPVNSGILGETWFIVYGRHLTGSRGTLNAALLAFSGSGFRQRWFRRDLEHGVVNITPAGVELEYVDRQPDGRLPEAHEVWAFVANGLILKSRVRR